MRNRVKGRGVGAAIAGAAALLVAVTTPAVGQQGGLEVTGYVGALMPLAELASQGDTLKAELSTDLAFGASLDYWFGGSWGVGIAGGMVKPELSVSTDDPLSGVAVSDVDYVHAEATIQFRPQLQGPAAIVLPYVGVGAGIRNLSFSSESGIEDVDDVVIILNAGAHISLGERTHIRLDIRDLVSTFDSAAFDDSRTQHEMIVSVGLGIEL